MCTCFQSPVHRCHWLSKRPLLSKRCLDLGNRLAVSSRACHSTCVDGLTWALDLHAARLQATTQACMHFCFCQVVNGQDYKHRHPCKCDIPFCMHARHSWPASASQSQPAAKHCWRLQCFAGRCASTYCDSMTCRSGGTASNFPCSSWQKS